MMDKKIFIILLMFFLVPFISAEDAELFIMCGGDAELIIGCFGDQQNFPSAFVPTPSVTPPSTPLGGAGNFNDDVLEEEIIDGIEEPPEVPVSPFGRFIVVILGIILIAVVITLVIISNNIKLTKLVSVMDFFQTGLNKRQNLIDMLLRKQHKERE